MRFRGLEGDDEKWERRTRNGWDAREAGRVAGRPFFCAFSSRPSLLSTQAQEAKNEIDSKNQ